MKIVECPLCESKFDISRAPEGMKLKCGSCKKIFGVVQGGEMVPVFEGTPAKTAGPRPSGIGVKPRPSSIGRSRPSPVIRRAAPAAGADAYSEDESVLPEGEISDVRLPGKTRSATAQFRRDHSLSEIVRAVEKKEKPEALLVLAGLAGLAAIGTLIWVVITITAPMDESMFHEKKISQKAPVGKESAADKVEKQEGKKPEEKSTTETPKEKTE